MKKIWMLALILTAVYVLNAAEVPGFKYVDATTLRIINKAWHNTSEPYTRIPAYMKDSVRENQWWLYNHSSGIAVRFATDSKRIAAQYNLKNNFHMQHMAMTGIKGTDLYRLNEFTGRWEYVNTARPQEKEGKADSVQGKLYVEHMDGKMHEYMLYLPLYDGINWMQIGVDSTAEISYPKVDNPRSKGKIVCYGTSVMQGGCASRTGMVSTSMIQRDFNLEVVNMATSGEGKMDRYIGRLMATIDEAICYVLDPVPNSTAGMCDTLTYDFVMELHRLRPEVPIIMVEGPMYPYYRHDSFFANYLPEKNANYRKNYELLKKAGVKNLYYMSWEGQTGPDMEGTVDGIHMTDLGFRAYADLLESVLKKALDKTGVNYNLNPAQTFNIKKTKTQIK